MEKHEMVLIEYNEKRGTFHHNRVIEGVPHDKPDTDGWSSIATTLDERAYKFCLLVECRNQWRKESGQKPLSVKDVKREWKMFLLLVNLMIKHPIEPCNEIERGFADDFSLSSALAYLGHPSFADDREEDWFLWDYEPLCYKESCII